MNKFFRSLIVASLLLSYLSPAFATFEKGLAHYDKGQFKAAFFIFKNLAEVGDKSSQFNLGVMYHRGEHVKRNRVMAYSWMRLAGEGGNDRYNDTAHKVLASLSEKAATAAKREFLELRSKYGQEVLKVALAPKPLNDSDCAEPPELISRIAPRYPKGAQSAGISGYVDVNYDISSEGYPRDITVRQMTDEVFIKPAIKSMQSFKWAVLGSGLDTTPVSMNDLEMRYKFLIKGDEKVIVSNLKKDARPLLKLAKQDDKLAQYRYAKHLEAIKAFDFSEVKPEYRNLNEWYLKAAENGHYLAQYELGRNMIAGRGCEVNSESGVKWLRAAAVSGHPFAQEELAMSALGAKLTQKNQAIYWLRRSAANDYYKAKIILAWLLTTNPEHSELEVEEAQSLLAAKPLAYHDTVRIFETEAAVLAAQGNFKKAVSKQKKALKKAKQLGWKIPVMNERLLRYNEGKTWTGPYYVQ